MDSDKIKKNQKKNLETVDKKILRQLSEKTEYFEYSIEITQLREHN